MARLEDVSVEELEDALEDAAEKKEVIRLLVAIIYKRGPSGPMIADWLDIREQTIYRWFDRLENEPIGEAVTDRPRPGRPPKLTEEQREVFRAAMTHQPAEFGFDEPAWSPDLAREFIAEEFGVEYTTRHVQRLLNDAGQPSQSP
jgi:transposase